MLNIGCCCFRIEGCSDGSTALDGVYDSRVSLVFIDATARHLLNSPQPLGHTTLCILAHDGP
jgi:hypothetical protein